MPRREKPDPLAAAIGARIRALRLEAGITLEKLAYETDSAKGYVSDIENGRALPTLKTLEKIAERLGVLLFDLMTFPESGPREELTDSLRFLAPGTVRRLQREVTPTVARRRAAAVAATTKRTRKSTTPK